MLWNAGLRRINVSLDTMDPDRFQQLTRRTGFEQVIEGILAAKAAGFNPVKVNAVAMKGRTEEDIVPLAREHRLEFRGHHTQLRGFPGRVAREHHHG